MMLPIKVLDKWKLCKRLTGNHVNTTYRKHTELGHELYESVRLISWPAVTYVEYVFVFFKEKQLQQLWVC